MVFTEFSYTPRVVATVIFWTQFTLDYWYMGCGIETFLYFETLVTDKKIRHRNDVAQRAGGKNRILRIDTSIPNHAIVYFTTFSPLIFS